MTINLETGGPWNMAAAAGRSTGRKMTVERQDAGAPSGWESAPRSLRTAYHDLAERGHTHAVPSPMVQLSPQVQAALSTSLDRIGMLGNHLPRRCGIATITTDPSEALSTELPVRECWCWR